MFLPAFDYSLIFIGFAVATQVFAAVKAISQKDIRLMLAYSTVSQIGLMMAARFLGNDVSFIGSLYHIVNHAIFKMILFLSAGLIIRKYQTADIYEIRGVMKHMPFAGMISVVGMLAITGFPLTSGSVSKYFMSAGLGNSWLEVLFWIMNFGTILIFVKYTRMLLPGKKEPSEIKIHRQLKQSSLVLLVVVSLVTGLLMSRGVSILLQVDLSIDMMKFLQKGIIYVVLVLVAAIVYKKALPKKKILYDSIEHSLSFSRMCLVFVAFFTVLIAYGLWVVN